MPCLDIRLCIRMNGFIFGIGAIDRWRSDNRPSVISNTKPKVYPAAFVDMSEGFECGE